MRDIFSVTVSTAGVADVPLIVEIDVYAGSGGADDPSESSVLHARVEKDVEVNGITVFEEGEAFPFERYEDEILEKYFKAKKT
jgi:hypothetical protein